MLSTLITRDCLFDLKRNGLTDEAIAAERGLSREDIQRLRRDYDVPPIAADVMKLRIRPAPSPSPVPRFGPGGSNHLLSDRPFRVSATAEAVFAAFHETNGDWSAPEHNIRTDSRTRGKGPKPRGM